MPLFDTHLSDERQCFHSSKQDTERPRRTPNHDLRDWWFVIDLSSKRKVLGSSHSLATKHNDWKKSGSCWVVVELSSADSMNDVILTHADVPLLPQGIVQQTHSSTLVQSSSCMTRHTSHEPRKILQRKKKKLGKKYFFFLLVCPLYSIAEKKRKKRSPLFYWVDLLGHVFALDGHWCEMALITSTRSFRGDCEQS